MKKTDRSGKAIEQAMNAWASAKHHCAHGGAGHPYYPETQAQPRPGRSRERYLRRTRAQLDARVLAAIESVDRSLRFAHSPRWFVRYLLYKYPKTGRFDPHRGDNDDGGRCFIRCGGMAEVIGQMTGEQVEQALMRLVRVTERSFETILIDELDNL